MTVEEIIQGFMDKVGVGRLMAFKLAALKIEYLKPNHGKWKNDT